MKNKSKNRGILIRIVSLILVLTALFLFYVGAFRLANSQRYLSGEFDVDFAGDIEVNGSMQYVRIRGRQEENPVILFLHGGPGNTLSCVSYLFTSELYEDYTVCEWDQPGCGQTYYNDTGRIPTVNDIISDMDGIVDELRSRFGKQKIIIMGYSWGSVPGLMYSSENGDKVSCYIGVGQCVDMQAATEYNMQKFLAEADADGRAKAQELYAALSEEGGGAGEHFMSFNELNGLFSSEFSKTQLNGLYYFNACITGPDTTLEDLGWKLTQGMNPAEYTGKHQQLMQFMYMDFNAYDYAPECPAAFISGEGDFTMPPELTGQYAVSIGAPMYKVEDAEHSVMFEASEAFAAAVDDAINNC